MKQKFYSNIGEKIKGLAWILGIVGCILLIVYGALLIIAGIGTQQAVASIVEGIIMILISPLMFVSTWMVYGFGELIINTEKIKEQTASKGGLAPTIPSSAAEPIARASKPIETITHPNDDDIIASLNSLSSLLKSGVITQEEYDAKKKDLLNK